MQFKSIYVNLLILLVVLVYGVSTLLANLPNSYIKIKSLDYSEKFLQLFSQNWNFFAPPPKANNRLYYYYYTYTDQDTTLIGKYEVIRTIAQAKREKSPFNFREEMLDYSLNNSFVDFTLYLHQAVDYNKMLEPDINDSLRYEMVRQYFNENILRIYPTQLVYNFGRYLARENNIPLDENHGLKFSMRQVPITKFARMGIVDSVVHEQILYESPMLGMNETLINPLAED